MNKIDIEWCLHAGIWQRTIGNLAVWAFVRRRNDRYEIATGTNGKPDEWIDYCAAYETDTYSGLSQQYKAKRRATAMAKNLIKGG